MTIEGNTRGLPDERPNWPIDHEAVLAATLGRHWLRRGKQAVAMRHFHQALEIEPVAMAYNGLVEIHTERGDLRRVQTICEDAVRHCFDDIHLHKALLEADRTLDGVDASLERHQLKRLSRNPIELCPGDVVAVMIVRNELLRLPWCLAELRRLGVDRVIIVDNNSNDGTTEFLLDQPDVSLWSTGMSYRMSAFGIAWIQALLREHAVGHWLVLLDADEILCFADSEQLGLHDFCDQLDRRGLRAASGHFIDMYSDRPVQDTDYRSGDDFLSACPFFDRVPYTEAIPDGGPFKNAVLYTGGARHRLFPRSDYWITKTPLIRYDEHVILTTGQHFTSHPRARIAHNACAVLHFKHFSSFDTYARSEVVRNEHARNAGQYRAYLDVVDATDLVTLFDPDISVRFESTETLVELGLLVGLAEHDDDVTEANR